MNLDTKEVENVRFKCQKCGGCCFGQIVFVSTEEINNILNFLHSKSSKEIEDFIFDCYLSSQSFDSEDFEDYLKRYKNNLFYFYMRFGIVPFKEANLVLKHIIFFFPTSKRCPFLNITTNSCFIHPVRPYTCRVFPFSIKSLNKDTGQIYIANKNCDGLGHGNNIDVEEIKKVLEEDTSSTEKDLETFSLYVKNNGFTQIEIDTGNAKLSPSEFDRKLRDTYFERKYEKTEYENNKTIDPFVELGIIPPSIETIIQKEIDNLKKNKS